jgi:hypothetical protein
MMASPQGPEKVFRFIMAITWLRRFRVCRRWAIALLNIGHGKKTARTTYWPAGRELFAHEDAPSVLLTVLNVPLMLPAMFLMTMINATTINPVNTAYSTAVGPSSLVRNRRSMEVVFVMTCPTSNGLDLVDTGSSLGQKLVVAQEFDT